MGEKERLDVRLVQEGLASSRERAKEWIKEGRVKADGVVLKKAGAMVPSEAKLEVTGDPLPYVSRGGLKLEKALDVFAISMTGSVFGCRSLDGRFYRLHAAARSLIGVCGGCRSWSAGG